MATLRWKGTAPAVAQVSTLTPGGTIEVGDLFLVTIGDHTISYAAIGTSVASVCAGLTAALAASTVPQFSELTFTDSTTHVTAAAKTAGKPFTITVDTTEGNGDPADDQTFDVDTITPSAGPNDWSTPANWSTGTVPDTGDHVVIENSAVDILYGINQDGITLGSLTIAASFTGKIGLPKINSGGYAEYRPDYLAIGATTVTIGDGVGSGSGRIKLDTGTGQTTLNVRGMANTIEPGVEALLWKGTHASNSVQVSRGSVGIAVFAGESATVATLSVGYRSNQASDSSVKCGGNATLTTVNQSGGFLTIASNAATITMTAGELTITAGAFTTINIRGGKVIYKSTGTASSVTVGKGGELDFTQDMRGRTITSLDLSAGATLRDPFKTVVFTNGIDIEAVGVEDVTLQLGKHIKVSRGTPT